MAFDTDRAALVQQEYRYETRTTSLVLARNPAARMVQINTQLDQASAAALAANYLADSSSPRVFEIVMEGVTFLDSFVGACPTFIPNFPKFRTDGRTMKVVGFTTDFEANSTLVKVRG